MSDKLLTMAFLLIIKAEAIHETSNDYAITVSVGRKCIDINISYFLGGNPHWQYTRTFTTHELMKNHPKYVYDEDLSKAAAFLQMIQAKVVAANG